MNQLIPGFLGDCLCCLLIENGIKVPDKPGADNGTVRLPASHFKGVVIMNPKTDQGGEVAEDREGIKAFPFDVRACG